MSITSATLNDCVTGLPGSSAGRRDCRKWTLTAMGTVLAVLAGTAVYAAPKPARIIAEYELPSLSYLAMGYTPEQTNRAAANGLAYLDRPGIASGLQRMAGNHYLCVSDRGPNFTVPGKRVFPLPEFTPTIGLFKTVGHYIVPEAFLPIVANDALEPVTGIPNSANDDSIPFLNATNPVQLPFNPNGMDVEDIHTLGRGFLLVEEYSPSLVTVNRSGKVTRRCIPQGKVLPGAAYPVSDTLPAILAQRRANRGFESLAVSADERTAYTVTQSPLGSTASGSPYANSRVVRLLRLDTSDPDQIHVTGQFILQMSLASTYPAGTRQRDLKISAAAWVNDNKLLLLERTDELLNGTNNGGAKLLLVDLSAATDINSMPLAGTLAPEDVAADFAALGITPATATVVFANEEIPTLRDFKLEGLSILNSHTVAISNDNDFGIGDFPGAISRLWVIRLGAKLPLHDCHGGDDDDDSNEH